MARAPVLGQAKTRLADRVGTDQAADLAAAALLDTLDAVESYADEGERLLMLTGELAVAARGVEITDRLSRWQVTSQQGDTFAARLVHAHHEAASLWGSSHPVVQIGMDTPQLTADDLRALSDLVGSGLDQFDAALGPATDGGWWGLATRKAGYVDGLIDVRMSRSDTGRETQRALQDAGATVGLAPEVTDVDTLSDAVAVAELAPQTRFARALTAMSLGATR
ncbi:MAG: TIGR04282 family arsenosugar biosynthesis glycosyltransferase [Nocardioidaceae bacterium]